MFSEGGSQSVGSYDYELSHRIRLTFGTCSSRWQTATHWRSIRSRSVADAEQLLARHATAIQGIQVLVPKQRGTQASLRYGISALSVTDHFHVCTWR